jgi:hypothetical protein
MKKHTYDVGVLWCGMQGWGPTARVQACTKCGATRITRLEPVSYQPGPGPLGGAGMPPYDAPDGRENVPCKGRKMTASEAVLINTLSNIACVSAGETSKGRLWAAERAHEAIAKWAATKTKKRK